MQKISVDESVSQPKAGQIVILLQYGQVVSGR